MSRWRYRLVEQADLKSDALTGIDFGNAWLTIYGGWMHVREGYAWDGCSPALRLPGTPFWLGPPDGPLLADGRPAAWRASLFHDALCQFRRQIPGLTKSAATDVFAEQLAHAGAPGWMRRLYPAAVRRLGPQDFLGDYVM